MFERLIQIESRYDELSRQMSDPALVSDQQQYQKITKQHRDLEAVVDSIRELKRIELGIHDAKAMAGEPDADMRAMAEEELAQLQAELPVVEERIRVLLLPRDPNDDKNVVLEIRAGTGGDEASLFAAEPVSAVHALCGTAPLARGSALHVGVWRARAEGSHRHY